MALDKSLAAEIEAVSVEALAEAIRRQVVLLRFNEASTLDQFFDADEIDLLCIRAANAVKDHVAAEIAALQGRAFEDGERAMRQRAEDVARAWMMPKLSATAQDFVSEQHIAERRVRNEAVIGIAAAIAALQPEGERNA